MVSRKTSVQLSTDGNPMTPLSGLGTGNWGVQVGSNGPAHGWSKPANGRQTDLNGSG